MISFATEQNWDSLEIYDGGDASAPRLGSFSGEVTLSPSFCESESSHHDRLQDSQCRPLPGRLFSVLTIFSSVGRLGRRAPGPGVKENAPSPTSSRLMGGGPHTGENWVITLWMQQGVFTEVNFVCGWFGQ